MAEDLLRVKFKSDSNVDTDKRIIELSVCLWKISCPRGMYKKRIVECYEIHFKDSWNEQGSSKKVLWLCGQIGI